jgi:uncharacterized protein
MASEANERLCRAAERGDVAEMVHLLAVGADPDAPDGMYGMTPLQLAAFEGHGAAIAALLAAGARVDGVDSSVGNTPLMYAASAGHAAAFTALLAAGADVNYRDNDDDTALHRASLFGRLDAARVLVEAGARTDVRNEDGRLPIDLVRYRLPCSLT